MTTAKMSLLLDQLFLLNQIVPELQKKKSKGEAEKEREGEKRKEEQNSTKYGKKFLKLSLTIVIS